MNYLSLLVRLSYDSTEMEFLGIAWYYWFAIYAVTGIFWGIITVSIATNRGYGDESGKWFLVGLVLGLIGVIIAASTVPRNTEASENAPAANTIPQANNVGMANSEIENLEKLKKYKELLDVGAITQEEYEIKKQELMK